MFLVFLPPLLASAGFYSSPRELRAELRPLTVLALGAVLATMGAVAVAAHELIDGLSWPAAFVLGAVVAPTDPVAAQATFSRMHVPERVGMLVEGEAMINDASALVAFRVALGAAIAGSFSVADAALDFVVSAVAGVAIGLAAGWIEVRVLRKLDDRPLAILLSLLFPYAAYVAAEEAHVSGVLAAVVCGALPRLVRARVLQRRHAPERERVLGGARVRPQRAAVPAARPAVPRDRRGRARRRLVRDAADHRAGDRRGGGGGPGGRSCSCRSRARATAGASGIAIAWSGMRGADLARGRAVGARDRRRPAQTSCS